MSKKLMMRDTADEIKYIRRKKLLNVSNALFAVTLNVLRLALLQ